MHSNMPRFSQSPVIDAAALDRYVDFALAAVHARPAAGSTASIDGSQHFPMLSLFDSDSDYMRVSAAQLLSVTLKDHFGDLCGAARLQRGLIDVVLPWNASDPLWRATVPTLLTTFASLAVDAGMGSEIRERASEWLLILERLGDRGHVSDLRLKLAEALLNDGIYEQARDILASEIAGSLRADLVPTHDRLSQKIDAILRRPDEPIPAFDGKRVIEATLAYLQAHPLSENLTRLVEASADNIDPMVLDQGAFGLPPFPSVPRTLEALHQAAHALSASRTPLMALQAVVQGIGIKIQAAGNGADEYRAIAQVAANAAAAATSFGYWEVAINVSWLGAVAWRRASEHTLALRCLLMIAAEIDRRRHKIGDPRLRAGVAMILPHLPWVLTEVAALTDTPAAMLYGIEIAKGRILGDLRADGSAPDLTPSLLVDRLRGVLSRRRRVHALTFLADVTAEAGQAGEIGLRALLVSADGTVHRSDIPLSPAVVTAVAANIDKAIRVGSFRDPGSIFIDDPARRPFEPLLEPLTPLVAWLQPLIDKGVLRNDDTLVHAADGSMHNVPLGMLPLGGKPLIETFACVAVPSLLLAINPMDAVRPAQAVAVLGPSSFERAVGTTFADEIETLRGFLPTTVAETLEDARAVLADPARRLLHFATHGTFKDDAPLRRGGLVVQDRNGAYNEADDAFMLTPEAISQCDLAGVHMTLRACMVGRVMQVTSREALGAVWAILSAGAASVVAASWSVDAPSAARWVNYFYDAWLGKKQSRAQAHRTACLALRAEGGGWVHPCHWAPFVLYAGTTEGDML